MVVKIKASIHVGLNYNFHKMRQIHYDSKTMCTEHSTRELDFTNDKVETKLLTLKLQAENDPNSFVFQLDHLATAAFSSGYVHLLLKSNSLERSTALVVNGVEVPGSFQHAESVETYMREESVSVKVEEPEAGEDPSVVAGCHIYCQSPK